MIKNILSAIAGYATWTVIFLGGSSGIRSAFSAVHDDVGNTSDVLALSCYLGLSMVASFVAGFVTGRLADAPKMRWVYVLTVLLLATGIPVQLSAWDTLPVWYHLAFLILLAPLTVWGGRKGSQ